MNLKSRLPHFFIHIWCQRAFCCQFCNLIPLSKCCHTLTVQRRPTGPFKYLFWDQVLCQWPRKYHQSVCADYPKVCTICFSPIQRQILLPDTGLVQSGFQIIIIILWKITLARSDSQIRPYQLYPTQVKFEEKKYRLIVIIVRKL